MKCYVNDLKKVHFIIYLMPTPYTLFKIENNVHISMGRRIPASKQQTTDSFVFI